MKKPRYLLLDTLRGIGIIGVVAYHFLYDLVRFFGVEAAWLDTTAAYLFQQGTVFLFVFIGHFWILVGFNRFNYINRFVNLCLLTFI